MARKIVDQSGWPKETLGPGQWRSISTDRVVLVPGDPQAGKTIRRAFDLYTKEHKSRHEIADLLNAAHMCRGAQRWTFPMLQARLTNPVYKGAYAYGRHEQTPSGPRHLPPEKWLVREHAFPGIVSEKQWNEATARMRDEVRPLDNAEMLEGLKRLWKRKGKLNSKLINASPDTPSVQAYKYHFEGINEAYRLIGYPIKRNLSFVHAIRLSRHLRRSICDEICLRVRELGGIAEALPVPGMLSLDGGITVKVTALQGRDRPGLPTIWQLVLGEVLAADVVVIARLKAPALTVLDYFVIPALSGMRGALTLRERNNDPSLEIYQFANLEQFCQSFRKVSFRRCA